MTDQLKFYGLSNATFYECINAIYQFIKPFLDKKHPFFEEYGAFKPRQYCIQNNNCPAIQGPVVQSVVSLTSSLRVISLTVLADSMYNILIFFAEKM